MTFATPTLLFALLVVPVVVVVYLRHQRGRRAAAEAFAAPAMAPSVMPNRPRWRRHVAPLVLLFALAFLIVAAARPRVTLSAPVDRLTIMLANDVSGSMAATDVKPNRVTAAQRAADNLVTTVPSTVSLGLMEFNQTPVLLQSPTHNRLALLNALGRLRVGGGTAIGNALTEAEAILAPIHAAPGKGKTRAVILLSDGYSTSGSDPLAAARALGRLGIPVFTVALGTPNGTIVVKNPDGSSSRTVHVPPDPTDLSKIARASGGRAYTVGDTSTLTQVYKQLGSQLGQVRQRRDITPYVIAAGLALLLLASAFTLRWFGRLI